MVYGDWRAAKERTRIVRRLELMAKGYDSVDAEDTGDEIRMCAETIARHAEDSLMSDRVLDRKAGVAVSAPVDLAAVRKEAAAGHNVTHHAPAMADEIEALRKERAAVVAFLDNWEAKTSDISTLDEVEREAVGHNLAIIIGAIERGEHHK